VKRLLLVLLSLACVAGVLAFSNVQNVPADLQIKLEERNPWNHLRLNNDPAEFRFAIVSDRTGGHRAKIFSLAVEQLNLMQPEFVVSVGDLIEGYKQDPAKLGAEWREFQGFVGKLQMPFFYVPGNHDIANITQDRLWQEKFGRRWFHFNYRGVLFLALSSEDPPGVSGGKISEEQLACVKQALDENATARWTLVFLHKPMWVTGDPEKNGWLEVEKLLASRPYTVFAGHVHRYQKFVRNGRSYYQLATTGGGSKLRGTQYGEFDHIVWVTMKQDGPMMANIMLDGIYPEDLRRPETGEPGVLEYNRRPTQVVKGKVYCDGCPVGGAYVVFNLVPAAGQPTARADAITEPDGGFTLSTYNAYDGAPAGEYNVTIVQRKPLYTEYGKPGPNFLPEKYAKADTSGLKATVKSGENEFTLELKR
jgi:hypothetical protein